MKPNLTKYKIGLGVIALIVLGLGVFVILQAANTKHDKQITKTAQDIARKLNDYIDNEQKVPDTLGTARITNVPSDISYQKLSNKSFKFCVTYKAKNSLPLNPLMFLSPFGGSPLSGAYPEEDWRVGGESSYLYIDESHPKGQHCQTITKDYWNGISDGITYEDQGNSMGSSTNSSSSPYTACGHSYNYSQSMVPLSAVTPKDGITGATMTLNMYPAPVTVKLAANAVFFDSTCKALTLNDFKAGDTISVYYDPYGEPATMVIKS